MRFFFLIIFLAGIALGMGYPWAVRNISGYEIATLDVYDPQVGFSEVQAALVPSEAPVKIAIEMQTTRPFKVRPEAAAIKVSATTAGRSVLEAPVTFVKAKATSASPQGGMIYRADVGTIDPVNGDENYVFIVSRGGAADLVLEDVDLILNAGAFDLDPRAVPTGYTLIVVGFVGFVAMFQRRRVINRRKEAEAPKWGRGPETGE